MAVNQDFRDLFAALNEQRAEFVIVGAHALAVHGHPRFTKDLDVLVGADPANAALVYSALDAFGAPLGELTPADLSTPGIIFQIGIAPNRIDILTSIGGVVFAEALKCAVRTTFGDQAVRVLSRDHLIVAKQVAGRPQDLIDIGKLRGESVR